jgi:hypothetical protein
MRNCVNAINSIPNGQECRRHVSNANFRTTSKAGIQELQRLLDSGFALRSGRNDDLANPLEFLITLLDRRFAGASAPEAANRRSAPHPWRRGNRFGDNVFLPMKQRISGMRRADLRRIET